MTRPRQVSVGAMKGHVNKLSKPAEFVVDLISVMSATVMECSEHPRHCRLVDCKAVLDCVATSVTALVKAYTIQVLHKKSDISGRREVVDAY